MTHRIDMILDFQYGSTGKGLIAGWLAKRGDYDTAICAFAPNAGHTYRDEELVVMTQQLPTAAIVSKTVKTILLGPGSAIHVPTLTAEIEKYAEYLVGKQIIIHPQAAIVDEVHVRLEQDLLTRIGSTAKGVGWAYQERIRRNALTNNTFGNRIQLSDELNDKYACIVDAMNYEFALREAESVIIEGAQGFGLSMYHGQYPYTTSRDVTPWQVAADCGIPFKWGNYIRVVGTVRTLPIRVNNRDGWSGPCYSDQRELTWEEVGVEPELTTVTKLQRRIFTFSKTQFLQALFHCGGYWKTDIFLNFCNYIKQEEVTDLAKWIETADVGKLNPPKVIWRGYGADDSDVRPI